MNEIIRAFQFLKEQVLTSRDCDGGVADVPNEIGPDRPFHVWFCKGSGAVGCELHTAILKVDKTTEMMSHWDHWVWAGGLPVATDL